MTVVGEILVAVGSLLVLLASVGILRLPDILSRMHAGTKAAALGVTCILVGTALLLPGLATTIKLLVAVTFQLMTAPVAAHVIGRAAYNAGTPLWEGTLWDDLKEESTGA